MVLLFAPMPTAGEILVYCLGENVGGAIPEVCWQMYHTLDTCEGEFGELEPDDEEHVRV